MRYLLSEEYAMRSWADKLGGVYDSKKKEVLFLNKEQYLLLMQCDGCHDISREELSEAQKDALTKLLRENVIRTAGFMEFLKPWQQHKIYPAEYKESVHWSITGACNLKCRHCFMSAPDVKHGVPTHEQILKTADSLVECGIFHAELTGGEPLIRSDFLDIVTALSERNITIPTIYTNGWLVDETLLDELEKRGQHPSFQLSYDGVGMHDWLRGVPGAEERTLKALKLLQDRKYTTSVSMCIHRKNRDTLRDSVKLMASYGVRSLKAGSMMQLGAWTSPEVRNLQLSMQENLEMIERYIPQYFEDNAPLSIMLSGAFMYTPGDDNWGIFYRRECPGEKEQQFPSCGVLLTHFYIGADGMVAPCMGMCDCGYASGFQNVYQTPLKEIIGPGSDFNKLCHTTVGEIRDHNRKCRECRYLDRCTGGCRNDALLKGDSYYAPAEENCFFFENGWEERIIAAVKPAFEAYIRRCPPGKSEQNEAHKFPVHEGC